MRGAELRGGKGREGNGGKWKVERATLSATMGPDVALVSAAITTPPLNIHPTIVVPVLIALGRGTPRAWRAALRS